MKTTFERTEDVLRVKLCGDIDHHSARDLCRAIDLQIASAKPKTVLLDFGLVSFMDSSGLAVAVGRKRTCSSVGSDLYITNCTGYPEKILRMAGADKLIKFKENDNEE